MNKAAEKTRKTTDALAARGNNVKISGDRIVDPEESSSDSEEEA